MLIPLPIDAHLAEIRARLDAHRALVVVAEPGAGKTTRVPPALSADGPVIVLQPRRVAARGIARRIADERGWVVGEEVGWHVRGDRRCSARTRVLLATEGILTARLQADPLLTGFRTVVLDEFHERSVHADVGLALARQAWLARDDLRLVVMSATLDAQPVRDFLGGCPLVEVPGRAFPVELRHLPGTSLADAVTTALASAGGDVLGFFAGAPEIARAGRELSGLSATHGLDLVPLHGGLGSEAQDRALRRGERRRVVLATNIAETSLTLDGIGAVLDTGWCKVARYDAARGIDSLEVERISADSAAQRAGRAGRTGPGLALRLWDARDRLRPHREAEIHRVDLAPALLDVVAWGGDAARFEWFDAPSGEAISRGLALLAQLGAIAGSRLTPLGDRMRRLPLHPRLARLVLDARGADAAVLACALLSERSLLPPRHEATDCDLLSAVQDPRGLPEHVRRTAADIERTVSAVLGSSRRGHVDDHAFRQAVLAAYPDRVAQRRAPGSPRVRLCSGRGAVLAPQSGVVEGEFLVAVDVAGGTGVTDGDPRIRLATRVEASWLRPTRSETAHEFDPASATVRARTLDRYHSLVLATRIQPADPGEAARLLADAWRERGPSAADQALIARARFAGTALDLDALLAAACASAARLQDVDLAAAVPFDARREIDRLAPERLAVPSGRTVALAYRDEHTVVASVKLQELFGLADTPLLGASRVPVTFELLAPNGRPVQTTRDLRSFWERTYPEVRKELRGRYPRHPWPEDPWRATPTHRTTRRPR
ncbi:MAG: ATP-dependent helicase HrpB [Vicinamibacterales bacterium]|jgi:ATP-dependent helicase HrpB|nr:ATP-dependent helicase HrpB [Vicinamibacterales bacterium]